MLTALGCFEVAFRSATVALVFAAFLNFRGAKGDSYCLQLIDSQPSRESSVGIQCFIRVVADYEPSHPELLELPANRILWHAIIRWGIRATAL